MDIRRLLEKMTIEEKIGQCVQLPGNYFEEGAKITGPLEGYNLTAEQIINAGSVLGISGANKVAEIQKKYLEKSRLKIPLLFMADVVHGYETIFPIPLALACSFNEVLVEKTAQISAKEMAVSGCNVTFAPMVDIVRDARWGRVMESNGEDSFLSSKLAASYVRGFQNYEDSVASCVKHFAAYGAVEAGRDYNSVDMSSRHLYEYYLKPYKAAIDENVKLVMTSFNVVDSIPATINEWLLRDCLRKNMGFNKVVISDWGAVKETINHGVCLNNKEAAKKAIIAGCDIEMSSPCYYENLKNLINEKEIEEKLLNESVMRVLQLKKDLGLFENPFKNCNEKREKKIILCEEHKQIAYKAALESIVLLKNECLPLKKIKDIAIVGPNAKNIDLNGSWQWKGYADNNITLKKALENKINVSYCGETFYDEQLELIDYVIYMGGESSNMTGEANSKSKIELPINQCNDLNELKRMGKTIIFINYSGRPLAFSNCIHNIDSLVQAWFLGTMTNQAIASVLCGEYNPSGKLAMSFPRSSGQCPIYYNHFNTGRPKKDKSPHYVTRYIDEENTPLFCFGHGLSYSKFKYSNINICKEKNIINISFKLTNISQIKGEEVVQVYFNDECATLVREVKQLIRFEKCLLKENEEKLFNYNINVDELKYYNLQLKKVIEKGIINFYIGTSSDDTQKVTIKI